MIDASMDLRLDGEQPKPKLQPKARRLREMDEQERSVLREAVAQRVLGVFPGWLDAHLASIKGSPLGVYGYKLRVRYLPTSLQRAALELAGIAEEDT